MIFVIHPASAKESDLNLDVRNILLSHHNKEDASKVDQLRSYSKNSNRSMQSIETVLISYLTPGINNVSMNKDRINYLLCDNSIYILGELRCQKALPSLKKLCKLSNDENMRHAALRAIIKTDREGLIQFAHEVFTNRKRYSSYGRFLLYEQLSPYVGVNAVKPVPLKKEEFPSGYDTLRPLILQFMINAIYEDISTGGGTSRLDKILCIAHDQYKTSYEREDVLKRLESAWSKIKKGNGSSSARAYPTEQLKILSALPKNKRTHVKIKKITNKVIMEKEKE